MFQAILCFVVVLGLSKMAQQSPLSLEEPTICNDTDEICLMRKELRNAINQINRLTEEEDELECKYTWL